jgi:hypothetical protein
MRKLYGMLPVGQNNAIGIAEVADMWRMSERRAREVIHDMWMYDLPVCNLFTGYFVPATINEVQEYQDIIRAYRRKLMQKEYRIRRVLERMGD